jgi:RimJ/RimL family protein N-acetyltransferase
MWTYDVGGRLYFRPMTDSLEDAYHVCRWRNMDNAREMFYNREVVTPDTHIAFMRNRRPHHIVWMVVEKELGPIGLTSLEIDVRDYTAEYGRAFIGPDFRGQGYGQEQEYMVLALAFEFFNLKYLWGDVLFINKAAQGLHRKTGWMDLGVDMPGHTNPAGPVLHIGYPRENWPQHRQKFIEKFGVTL